MNWARFCNSSITTKAFLAILGCLSLTVVIYLAIAKVILTYEGRMEAESQLKQLVKRASHNLSYDLWTFNDEGSENQLKILLEQTPLAAVSIHNVKGDQRFGYRFDEKDQNSFNTPATDGMPELAQQSLDTENWVVRSDWSNSKYTIAAPIYNPDIAHNNDTILAIGQFEFDTSYVKDQISSQLGQSLGAAALLLIVFCASYFLILRRLILRRVVGLKAQMAAADEYQKPFTFIPAKHPDEIDVLCEAFVTLSQNIREASKNQATFDTMRMMAHDMKAPFTMLEALISLLRNCRDNNNFLETFDENLPHVDRKLARLKEMISNINESQQSGLLKLEEISIRELVRDYLGGLHMIGRDIEITTSYEHTHYLCVDSNKISRVVANIVANALEAMPEQGRLWVKTRQMRESMEVVIGNSGSCIPDDLQAKVFDTLFTHDKVGGTGLGLAITKKIINAHGGQIYCTSSPEFGVEFIFQLPCSVRPEPHAPTSTSIH